MPPCAAEIARRIRVVAKTTDLFLTIGFPPPAREKVAGMERAEPLLRSRRWDCLKRRGWMYGGLG